MPGMSMELVVLYRAAALLDRVSWQARLDELALPVSLNGRLDPESASGFQPVTLKGQDTGFEFSTMPAADYIGPAKAADADIAAVFRWGGRIVEMGAAIACAAALTVLTSGVMYDPQEGQSYSADEAVAYARDALRAV